MPSSSLHDGIGDRTEIRLVSVLVWGANQDHSALNH